MDIEFKIAEIDDLAEIVRIYNKTIKGRMATADLKPVTVEERKPWFEEHQTGRRPLWVVKSIEKPRTVGWVSFGDFYGRDAYEHTAEISVYVDNAFRGQHLGRSALRFAESKAAELKITNILAFIFSHNTPSIGLFGSEGYEEWGQLPKVAEMDHKLYDLTIMGKRLSEE